MDPFYFVAIDAYLLLAASGVYLLLANSLPIVRLVPFAVRCCEKGSGEPA